MRLTKTQPDGGVIVSVFGRNAIVASIVSPATVPTGLLMMMVDAVPFKFVAVAPLYTMSEDGIADTAKVCAAEVPAPGVDTVTALLPTDAISAEDIVAVTCAADTKLVVRGVPFQLIVEEAV